MIPDDLAAELPPPRDDEPASLRQDIIDELSDHLHCALQREVLASGGRQSPDPSNEQSAYTRAITRFGNPATLARRLWFDAMKERLMAQKLTLGLVTLGCVLMCVLLWMSIKQNSAFREMLLAEKARNASLLDELKSMQQSATAATASAGWAPVVVRLETESGQPASGRVQISGTAINAGNENAISTSRETDESGRADFGLLPHGNYELFVSLPETNEYHRREFMLAPGAPAERTIVCPDSLPSEAELTFDIQPPEPLHADELVYVVELKRRSRSVGGVDWSPGNGDDHIGLAVGPDGHVLGRVIQMWTPSEPEPHLNDATRSGFSSVIANLQKGSITIGQSPIRAGRYDRREVSVFARIPGERDDDPTTIRVFSPVNLYRLRGISERLTVVADAEHRNMWTLHPSDEDWAHVISTFYGSDNAAFVAIPEGRRIVEVPTDIRNAFLTPGGRANVEVILGNGANSASSTGASESETQTIVLAFALEIVHVPDDNLQLRRMTSSAGRASRSGRTPSYPTINIKLLVDAATAEALELAQKAGTVRAIPLPADDQTETSLNPEALETLKSYIANATEPAPETPE